MHATCYERTLDAETELGVGDEVRTCLGTSGRIVGVTVTETGYPLYSITRHADAFFRDELMLTR